jgi:GDPmannose 4,6-dehydratase
MKKALITGVTGQDGSYLAELLLSKGYEVHGVKRKSTSFNTENIDHLYHSDYASSGYFKLHYGDLTDSSSIMSLVSKIRPDEIYNLAAQSHVAVSFEIPEITAEINGLGTLRLLEAMRTLGLQDTCKFYQASTSELFGHTETSPQSELTPFNPTSPYAVSKAFAHYITKTYREAYGFFACNGVLFNHESPRRGETFVTRKITRGLARLALGYQEMLELGNLDSLRDWGHAREYVAMQWRILQEKHPDDYVIASGKQHSIRDFINWAAEALEFELEFIGEGLEETARVKSNMGKLAPALRKGDTVITINPRYFRLNEVPSLLGDAKKASKLLGWQTEADPRSICHEMVLEDLKRERKLLNIDR